MYKLLSFLMLLFVSQAFYGQSELVHPSEISKAVHFDVTPPLKDMPFIEPSVKDRTWKTRIIGNKLKEHPPFTDDISTVYDDPGLQQKMGEKGARGPIVNIDGTGNVNGVYPPDTDGDVGPNHYFQMINLSFAIYDKAGNKLYGPANNSTLWQGFIGPWTGTNDGDPVVLYDEMADRWMASQFAVNTNNGKYYQLVAVSVTPDPLGEYYRYAFEYNYFNDYPKMGVWHDGYYTTYHFFNSNLNFVGAGISAFERDKMLTGDPDAQMVTFGPVGNIWGILPADHDGDNPPPFGAPAIFLTHNVSGNKKLQVYELAANWGNPSASTFQSVVTITGTANFNSNLNGIPQPNSSQQLDALTQMLMFRLAYRNFNTHEAMVVNHTVNSSGKAGIRWYELRKEPGGQWDIFQYGTYAPDATNRWMGSIAMNSKGDIGLGFNVSSSTIYPSIRYTGRRATDIPGMMTFEEVELATGTSSQNGISRWGDYACMSVDPADDSTFWFTTEYMKGAWKTKIMSFDFSPVQAPQANAGVDDTVCQSSLFTASGTALYHKSAQWSTSGDGNFATPGNLSTYYMHGPTDLANGQVTLKLTVSGYLPNSTSADSMTLFIFRKPAVNAGVDTVINQYTVLNTNAVASNFSSCLWTTAGDGLFSDPDLVNTMYTPGAADIANGFVNLTLTGYPNAPCQAPVADVMKLSFDQFVGLEEPSGNQKPSLEVQPNPNQGMFNLQVNNLAESEAIDIYITNLEGKEVFRTIGKVQGKKQVIRINTGKLPKGTYLINVKNPDVHVTQKLLIN